MAPPVTVDFHAHAQSPKAAELIASAANNPGADANPHNQHLFATRYSAAFSDIAVRMQTMDRQRIDMQVVSPAPNYAYWADEATSPQIATASNEHVAEVCAHYPDRLVGLGHVSLQFPRDRGAAGRHDPGFARPERHRDRHARRRRRPGRPVARPVLVGGRGASRAGVHPSGRARRSVKRVAKYYLGNIIGNPLDTTIALTNLIFGGVLERFPNLRVVAAHGGGYLPAYFSRSTHGYEVRPEAREIPHPPLHYLRRITVDNLVYEPEFLAHVINVVGASNVVLGTDYPFDMGQDNPVDLLEAVVAVE